MVRQHHRLNGQKPEKNLGDSEGQGSLACCSPWGHNKSDTTQPLNNNNLRCWRLELQYMKLGEYNSAHNTNVPPPTWFTSRFSVKSPSEMSQMSQKCGRKLKAKLFSIYGIDKRTEGKKQTRRSDEGQQTIQHKQEKKHRQTCQEQFSSPAPTSQRYYDSQLYMR